jgi:PAS domain S-box-containing protein
MSAQKSEAAPKPVISQARPAILIVEDEVILAMDLKRTLIDLGYDAYAIASSAEAAVQRANERCPDLVMMDIRIKGPLDGIQTASLLKTKFSTAIIYLTAHSDKPMIERAKETEPQGYLLKPVSAAELRTTVEIALYKHQIEQLRAEKAEFERLQQSALMEMSRAVHESNEHFCMMVEAVKDYAITMIDLTGRISSWNVGAERLKGYSKREIVGQHFSRFYSADDIAAQKPEKALADAARLGKIEDQGWRVRKDGTRFLAEVIITAVYDPSGQLRGFAKVTRDITAQKNVEGLLRHATREAERANGAKSLFLANMSHEIRTPMNAVIGLTYLLERTSLSAEQSRLLAQINVASKLLLAVINDVLDLSKIEAGELIISRVAFTPRHLMGGLHAIMRVQAELKGIVLALDVSDGVPAALVGDAARLNQILTNLISNAIKFTERGGVTLQVRRLESTSPAIRLCFTVRDTGIGIDPAAQVRLFTPFIQADESITRRYGGTGLGLSIIDNLVKLMGGSIEVSSTAGVGSEFRIVLDFAAAESELSAARPPVPASPGESPLAGVSVLVVDDYDLNLVAAKRLLELAGALVWVAINGQDALEQLRLHPDRFNIVLMDIQMPIMDGYEATRRIRADLGLLNLPIIAVSAGALLSEAQRATAAGMNDFIIKPFDPDMLILSILKYAVHAGGPAGEPHAGPRPPVDWFEWPSIEGIDMDGARIRLRDDSALFRTLLKRFLDDFADMAVPSSRSGPADLAEQAGRMHKMQGGAAILGAKRVQDVSEEVEAACLAGDATRAGQRASELVACLNALRSSAARAFQGTQTGEWPIPSMSDISVGPQRVGGPEAVNPSLKNSLCVDFEGRCSVLLVDDDDIVRTLVANLLERSGYRVGEAASGEEALRALRGGDYPIVITDWKMPGMSGLELCRELRVGGNRDLYVMVLSASDRQQDMDLSHEAGADAYVIKSAANEGIIECMAAARRIVQLRSSSRETKPA